MLYLLNPFPSSKHIHLISRLKSSLPRCFSPATSHPLVQSLYYRKMEGSFTSLLNEGTFLEFEDTFCKQYKRTTEFLRLCEIIRKHLATLNKYRDQRDRPDLSSPESIQFYLDTRFEQLKIATELELWQETFCSVEDFYGLTCMVKKMPKTSWMAVYYAKLTEIFWISTNHLYHACAWFKLFQLEKSLNKNLNQKYLQLIASSVLLAALSIPPIDHTHRASHVELEHEKECNLRMSNLIGFNLDNKIEGRDMLSRASLLADLKKFGC